MVDKLTLATRPQAPVHAIPHQHAKWHTHQYYDSFEATYKKPKNLVVVQFLEIPATSPK